MVFLSLSGGAYDYFDYTTSTTIDMNTIINIDKSINDATMVLRTLTSTGSRNASFLIEPSFRPVIINKEITF